jgi:poly-gamma-glutamate synthesis protein (capsule biosynthesis protein)
MQSDIRALRPKVDFLIVFTHWGTEYVPTQNNDQRAMARLAIDTGADLVVGAHPHVIQPNEVYRDKPIIYSLGNFIFDEMWSDDVRTGEVLALTVQGSHLQRWQLRKSYITGDYGEPRWQG